MEFTVQVTSPHSHGSEGELEAADRVPALRNLFQRAETGSSELIGVRENRARAHTHTHAE